MAAGTHEEDRARLLRVGCWLSWSTKKTSMTRLLMYRNNLFSQCSVFTKSFMNCSRTAICLFVCLFVCEKSPASQLFANRPCSRTVFVCLFANDQYVNSDQPHPPLSGFEWVKGGHMKKRPRSSRRLRVNILQASFPSDQ